MSEHYQAENYSREISPSETKMWENEPTTSYAKKVKLKTKYQVLEQEQTGTEASAWTVPKKDKTKEAKNSWP